MPYGSNEELPDQVRDSASSECQTIFRKAWNSIRSDDEDATEKSIFQRAWSAMKDSCSKSDGEWTKQSTNMELEVLTNDVEPRTETEDGKEYTVIPIRFIKSMNLDKGYVPEREIQDATMNWNGTPIITDHPTDEVGRFVSVENGDKSVIGEIRDPQSIVTNDTVTMGEAWIDPEAIQDDEDKAVLQAIQNGETLSVSSAYVGDLMPSGKYDGEEHEQVRGNLDPDHVAVFEDKEGRCSIEDGCFVGPDADMSENEVMVNASAVDTSTDDSGNSDEDLAGNRETSRRPTFDGTTTGEWSKPTFSEYVNALGYDANQVRDLNNSQKSAIADMTLLGNANADTLDELVVFPVVDPETRNLSERALNAVLSGRGSSADISGRALESARAVAESLKEENFDQEQSSNASSWKNGFRSLLDKITGSDNHMTDESKTDVLVNEHGFDRENLPSEDSECFSRIYDKFAANEGSEESGSDASESQDDPSDEGQEVEDNTMGKEDKILEELESIKETQQEHNEKFSNLDEEVADAMAANQEREQKADLVDTIVANSDDHDPEDKDTLMDSPKSVLESLAGNLETKSTDFSALQGGSADVSSNSDDEDMSSFPAMGASERIAEKEAGN